MRKSAILVAVTLLAGSFLLLAPSQADENVPANADVVKLENSTTSVATWTDDGGLHYAINRGSGNWHQVDGASNLLRLRYTSFDPLDGVPEVPEGLSIGVLGESDGVFIVQFITQPLAEYRSDIEELGGTIYKYLAHNSYLVRLSPESRVAIEQLPYVRWVGTYQPAYKFEAPLLAVVQAGAKRMPATRVNIMVFERGLQHKTRVAQQIAALGGELNLLTPDGFRLEATLDPGQLVNIAQMPEVMWIDLWGADELDMNIARSIGGANFVESVEGYAGQGVRAEVCDTNLFSSHIDFQTIPPVFHGPRSGSDDHGTGTYGINFGTGTGSQSARGMVPAAQGIFADFNFLTNRYQHTAELVQSPYFAVYQSNSWGGSRTRSYNSISAEMDDIIFINDIIITQSQSNANNQDSRPQAWAKNVVSVGGINHRNTLTKNDDFWGGASIGPAADGRIKPDLSHFYDSIFTTDDVANGYRNFGGTSGATPIVAGHFGLYFQMWSDGIFGNEVDKNGTVFENRSHASTAKAMLINSASSYSFSGTGHNLTRTHQGWGLPDVQRMYEMRDATFVVDEEVVLENLETATFDLEVDDQTPEFRATLVYTDTMGTTSSNQHRINDLSLKVTAPGGAVYWGNNGLLSGNWSTSGGSSNTIDTVENVFVQNPAAGTWTVEVIAAEINEDAHVETSEMDADFGLVVSGIVPVGQGGDVLVDSIVVVRGIQTGGSVADLHDSDNVDVSIQRNPSQTSGIVEVEFKSFSPLANPGSFQLTLEAAGFFRSAIVQSIEFFDYDSGVFVEFDSRQTSRLTDSVAVAVGTGDLSRFVEAGTQSVLARVLYTSASQRQSFSVAIDQVYWSIELKN